jgi:hypothetical protein
VGDRRRRNRILQSIKRRIVHEVNQSIQRTELANERRNARK